MLHCESRVWVDTRINQFQAAVAGLCIVARCNIERDDTIGCGVDVVDPLLLGHNLELSTLNGVLKGVAHLEVATLGCSIYALDVERKCGIALGLNLGLIALTPRKECKS